ncbi:MAG: YlbG family protein [Tuberibacillus sp.]
MLTGRTGLIVWLNNTKYVKVLKKFGNIHYVSKKMAYAVLYCESEKVEAIVQRLEKQKFTKRVDYSHLGELKTEYASKKEINQVEEELIY